MEIPLNWLPKLRSKNLFERAQLFHDQQSNILTSSCLQSVRRVDPSDSRELREVLDALDYSQMSPFQCPMQEERKLPSFCSASSIKISDEIAHLIWQDESTRKDHQRALFDKYLQDFEDFEPVKIAKEIVNQLHLKLAIEANQKLHFKLRPGFIMRFQLKNHVAGLWCNSTSKILEIQPNCVQSIKKQATFHYKGEKRVKVVCVIEKH